MAQLARQHKAETPALDHYLANKKAVRAKIALSAGITKDQAKTCLIALIYGANLSQRAVDAIPAEIGKEAAQRLYSNDLFRGIANDIREARKVVIAHLRAAEHNAKGKRNGFISNALGKTIKRNAPSNEIMAPVLQGIEAKMLGIAIDLNLDEMLLLQHDGFTTLRSIDRTKLETEIHRQTGFEMSISESQIQL